MIVDMYLQCSHTHICMLSTCVCMLTIMHWCRHMRTYICIFMCMLHACMYDRFTCVP